MRSPFPGMDPYIESAGLWEDFHPALIAEIKNALSLASPERYVVRFGERSYVVLVGPEGKESQAFFPDRINAPVVNTSPGISSAAALAETVADPEPIVMRPYIQEQCRETFVEILETNPELRLATCIEVLSPSNKRAGSKGWRLYQRKRQSLFAAGINLVEIDLLRRGERMLMVDPWPATPYTILVYRPAVSPTCRAWPVHFRRSIPSVPVPLLQPDPDIWINTQPMIDAIYSRSRYDRSIDYAKPLDPPWSRDDATWFEEQLRAALH